MDITFDQNHIQEEKLDQEQIFNDNDFNIMNILNIYQTYVNKKYNQTVNIVQDTNICQQFMNELEEYKKLKNENNKYIQIYDFDNLDDLEDQINNIFILIINNDYHKVSLSVISLMIYMNNTDSDWFESEWDIIKLNEI